MVNSKKHDAGGLIGKRNGHLEIDRIEWKGHNKVVIAKCDCGQEKAFWKISAFGNQKSCGCGIDDYGIKATQRRSWNFRLQGYKNGAKTRGYCWELTFHKFVEIASKPCYFCGDPPKTWECFSNAPSVRKDSPSAKKTLYEIKISGVDRLDNSEGYTEKNCVPCCVYCNRAKSDLTIEQFISHVEKMHKWLQKPKNQK
jgi:hypothetical protein